MTTTAPPTPGRLRRPTRRHPDPDAVERDRGPQVTRPTGSATGRRVSSLPFLGLIAGLLAAGLLGLLIINNSLAAGSFEQARLRSDQILLGEQEQALRQEVERLSSPTRVREAAREAGLVPAATTAYFDVMTGQILGVPLPAGEVTGATGVAPETAVVIIDPTTGQPIDATTVVPLDPAADSTDTTDTTSTDTGVTDPTATMPDAAQPQSSDADSPRAADEADGAVLGGEPEGVTAYDRAVVSGGGR